MNLLNASHFALWFLSTGAFALLSRRALQNPACHGFYRFFAFCCSAGVLIPNLRYWQHELFSPPQLLSWFLLFSALGLLVNAVYLLTTQGGRRERRNAENFGFENTAVLIESGVFRWIRHPMYGALILFTWGVWLKQMSWPGLALSVATTVLLWVTAKREEEENRYFFGVAYDHYSKRTRNFIPWLF